ncbi:MAG: 2-amino-4-hydroxy-6-hydroxymethyldihydropteridine diphosphokinase [Scrofimicrobium sp.]
MSDHRDVIALRGLSAVGSHGVYDFERHGAQVFSADLKLHVDSRQAALTDDVAYTVDYSELAEKAVEILSGTPVYLLETLANKLAAMALTFPLVHRVEVTVHKPMAPVRHQFKDVSVTVTRTQGDRVATKISAAEAKATPQEESRPPAQIADSEKPAPEAPQKSPVPLVNPFPTRAELNRPKAESESVTPRSFAGSRSPLTGVALIPRSFTDGSPIYRAVLSLGSNKGDSLQTLAAAIAALRATPGFEVSLVGPVVRTLPVLEPGALPQPDYLNTVVIGRTVLPPPVLLQAVNRIEADFGRVRERRWAARTLDIDIVSLDQMRINSRDLTLPHPRAHERAFVLFPWAAIAPEDRLPGFGTVSELLASASDRSGLLSVRENWLDADGRVTSGTERQLNERPKRERLTAQADLPSVTVRGERLHLAPIDRDPIFKKLLEKELRQPAPPAPPQPTATPVRESAVGKPPRVQPVAEPPTATPLQGTPVRAVRAMQASLPDWRVAASGRVPKVVDESAHTATTTGSLATGRRVTVRPTPTGSIPIAGGSGQSRR